MTIKQLAVASALLCGTWAAHAQVALAEGFNNVDGLISAGWLRLNASPSPGISWFQGQTGAFNAAAGPADSYAAANFLSTTAVTGPASNWLITPRLLLDNTSTVSLAVRAAGGGFLDTLEVRLSTTGTAAADFTTLLGSYSTTTDQGWVARSFSALLSQPTQVYIGFRYVVADVATAGNYLGIDNLVITAVPEPTTSLLLGLGLTALAGSMVRRRAAA